MKVHYAHSYLLNPVHKVTIDLVGCGGTGSQVLTNLARMNEALVGLGHPGLHVTAWDPDQVMTANLGRQLFSPADLGMNKAMCLVTRINRFFGYEWQASPLVFKGDKTSNITVTCVDSAKARITIGERLRKVAKKKFASPTDDAFYWLDLGNLQKTGQVVLGTLQSINQPTTEHRKKYVLQTVIDKFPQLRKIKEENQGPSCSLAEALQKQDLFINSTLAQLGCNILWKLFRDGMIRHQGCFVNLDTLNVNPIVIN